MYQSRDGDDERGLRRLEDLVVVRDRSSADVDVGIVEGVVGNKGSQDVVSVMNNGTKDEVTAQDKIRIAHMLNLCAVEHSSARIVE